MPRKPMITRTINAHEYSCTCLDTETKKMFEKTFRLTRKISSLNDALKTIRQLYETDNLKICFISKDVEIKRIYGMTENEFMKHAKPMDENRRFIDDN